MSAQKHALDNQAVAELLTALIHFPNLHSHIEASDADELCDRGLFDLEQFTVTGAGRDWLAQNEGALCA